MKVTHVQSLDSFLSTGEEISKAIVAEDGDILPALREFHGFFTRDVWEAPRNIGPTSALLGVQGHFYWLAAVRLALSGQLTGVFPLLRTGLEAFCYGARIHQEPDLGLTWQKRDDSPEAAKACRKAFTSAVSDVSKAMEAAVEGAGKWILEAYDAAIEWGGHPNPKVVFPHLRVEERDEEFVVMSVALHAPGSKATCTAVVACLDLGLAMAAVAAWTGDGEAALAESLTALNDLKTRVADQLSKDTA